MRDLWTAAVWAAVVSSGVLGGLNAQSERPKLQFLRQNEDWSWLAGKDTSTTGDFWDPYKHIPLDEDGSVWASLGGSLRFRYEAWDNFNFGAPPGVTHDDGFLLTRLRAHADVHVGEDFRAFVEFKGAYCGDRRLVGGRRTLDSDTADLQQAFVDIRLKHDEDWSITLRPGRQMLSFGKERLISPLAWSNTLRTWDGVSAVIEGKDITITGFFTWFAPVQRYSFNDGDLDFQLYGAYLTGKWGDSGGEAPWLTGYDLYLIGVSNDEITFNGTSGHEDRVTLGVRVWGNLGDSPFDYDMEAAWQLGEVGSGDVNAYMLGAELGYSLAETAWNPRLHLGLDIASGDHKNGGDVQTFNQLFPLGHAYLGYIDTIGRQNILDLSAGATCTPVEKLKTKATWHQFWLMDDNDALYNAGGGVVRPGGATGSTSVGSELDITVEYPVDAHLKLLFGYSHFFDGSVLEQSGTHDDIDFAYAQAEYTF